MPQVPVERPDRLVAADVAGPACQSRGGRRAKVDVLELEPEELRSANARIREDAQDRLISPSVEQLVPLARREQGPSSDSRKTGGASGNRVGFIRSIGDSRISPSSTSHRKNAWAPR
jgi:hypothetical protein